MAPVVEAAAAVVVCRVVTSALSAAHSDFRPKSVTPWAAVVAVAEAAAVELACSQESRSLPAVTTAEAVVVAAVAVENRLLLPQIARNFSRLRQK